MPRVKPKRRIADRRTESALFSMDIFDDVMAEIAAASSSAALATDTGAAGAARGALLGGDCLGALGSIRCLQAASSLKEQNNALLKLKADMNNYLSGKDLTSAENGSKSVELLLRLYLSPESYPLRKSMDWVGDMLSRAEVITPVSMQAVVTRACERVLRRALGELRGPVSPAVLMSWVHSLNTMGLLDRDVPWLDDVASGDSCMAASWPLVPELGGGSLYLFVRIALLLFQNAAEAVLETPFCATRAPVGDIEAEVAVEEEAPSSSSGAVARAARFADCAGEVMRVLNIALKARRAAYVSAPHGSSGTSEMWISLVTGPAMPLAVQLLSSNIVGKDVVASTALGLTCLQWISRHYFVAAAAGDSAVKYHPEVGVLQLKIIIEVVRSHYGPDAAPEVAKALAAGLCPALAKAVRSLPLDSACGLFRAALNVYDDSSLMCSCNSSLSTGSKEIFLHTGVYDAIMELCVHRAPEIQAAGMQALEAWVSRLETYERARKQSTFDGMAEHTRVSDLASKICNACNVVSRSWSHPLKNINHLVPAVYQRLVDLMSVLDTHATARRNIEQSEKADIWWTPLIKDALSQPVNQRGRYQAITILLPRVGAVRFLQSHPQIISSLIQSMRVRDVSSAACSLLGSILSVVKKSLPYSEFRNLWEPHVVDALCSADSRMRLNAADYLISEMIKVDSGCCPRLINRIRRLNIEESTDISVTGVKLLALVHIVLQARLNNVAGQEVVAPPAETDKGSGHSAASILNLIASSLYLGGEEEVIKTELKLAAEGPLQTLELSWACLSQDVDLRLTAVTAITSSQLALQPIPVAELDILRETIGYSMKTSNADDRHRLLRAVRGLLMRLRDTCRAATRDLKKLTKAAEARSKDRNSPAKSVHALSGNLSAPSSDGLKRPTKNDSPLDETVLLRTIKTGHDACHWLSAIILGNLYPGSTSEREVVALELYLLVLDSFIFQDAADDAKLLRHFISPDTVKALVNMLVSAWDRPRKLAAEALSKLPKPLCGITSSGDVRSLVMWGSRLSGSSRQRESDAGALMLRVVMSTYCNHLGWDISVLHPGAIIPSCSTECANRVSSSDLESLPLVSRLASATAAVRFISGLCDLMVIRLQGLEALFSTLLQPIPIANANTSIVQDGLLELEEDMSEGASPLCHGLFLALKYALEEVCSSNLLDVYVPQSSLSSSDEKNSGSSGESAWVLVLSRLLQLSQTGLDLALSVVAEAQTDVSFAPSVRSTVSSAPDMQTSTADVGLSKGPTNVNSYMFLNTNSFMDNKLNFDNSKKSKVGAALIASEDADIGNDIDIDGLGENIQRAVVGAWLLVKESTAFLANMVRLPAIKRHGNSTNDTASSGALSDKEVELIGSTLLDALGRLKHLGAIAEAQQALQDICSHLLLLGDKNSYLCSLPGLWLESVLKRLENEQQVFILRRSAGFGYTFIALLKSEPPKSKSVLVPMALERLLCIANVGLMREGVMTVESLELPVEQLQSLDSSSAIGWRACVHSINVVRLLVLDGVIGPRMNAFIAQAMMVAVRGFVSSRWAVRNSAMMLFSAVIQRSVDVEKRESGGGKAATAVEFFQRFPSLFPFLLKELASIAHFDVHSDERGRPVSVTPKCELTKNGAADDYGHTGATHPSLFPILLLISKFRAPASSASTEFSESSFFGAELFIPLLEKCHSDKVYQVREIAARALTSIIPLDIIPELATEKINQLISCVNIQEADIAVLTNNQVHGKVLQLYSLVSILCRYIDGATYHMGNNKTIFDGIKKKLADSTLVPLQYLLSALMMQDFGQLESNRPASSAFTDRSLTGSTPANPAVVVLLIRTLNMLNQLIPEEQGSHALQNMLAALCNCALRDLFMIRDTVKPNGFALLQHPYAGAMCEEALTILFPIVLKATLLSIPKKIPVSEIDWLQVSAFPFIASRCVCRCCCTEPVLCSVAMLLNLLDTGGINSEVRRGVLQGLSAACANLAPSAECSSNNNVAERADDASFSAVLPFLLQHDILLRLLHRSIAEAEPPEALLSIELLCQILRVIDAESLPNVMDKTAAKYVVNSFQAGGWAMWHLMKGPKHFSPIRKELTKGSIQLSGGFDSSRFVVTTLDYLSSKHLYDDYLKAKDIDVGVVAPTSAAACAVEVLGWSICTLLRKFSFDSREKTYTVNESKQMERTSALLNMWLSIIEHCTMEQMPVFCRVSAVRSIRMAKVLIWSVDYGIAVLRGHSGPKVEKKVNGLVIQAIHNGEFACRLWLVILKLMQDDDIDIRSEMNVCLSDAHSNLTALMRKFDLEHLFFHQNLPSLLKVSDTLKKHSDGEPQQSKRENSKDSELSPVLLVEKCYSDKGALPIDLEPSQGRSIEAMVNPIALCVMWSLLCDRVPLPDVKTIPPSSEDAYVNSVIASTYGEKKALYFVNGVPIFIAHRGVKCILEAFNEYGGGSIQPLMQYIMKEMHGESDTQQIFEADQANLHAECITAASVISSALGVVVNALPPAATMGISNFLFSRAEGAVSMLQLSLQKLSWIGGSSYHPNIFNYAFCALGAVRMQRSSHPDAVMNEELVSMERRLKLCAYQLVRRSNQLLTIDGIAITCPAPSGKAREEHAGQLDAESSWYTSFSLSRLVQLSGLEDTVAAVGLGVPTALLEETSKSRSNSVLSTSECDNTAHSETAHLRAPILGTAKVAATIHPMLIFLLHELILFDGSSDCSRRTIEQAESVSYISK